jgi:nucleoid-associated protein YgaU
MSREKYQSLIDMANSLGISGLDVSDGEGFTKITGAAGSAADKQKLWDEYERLDPGTRSGDLVLDVSAPEAAAVTHTVQSGDSLSKIGSHYGVDWHAIHEANRDLIGDDPDKIHPGQELKIPQG